MTSGSLTCLSSEKLPERYASATSAPLDWRPCVAARLLQCGRCPRPRLDPLALIVDDRARARAAGDPFADLCVLATDGGSTPRLPGVRPIVLRDVGPQGIGLLISRTSPKWEPLSAGRYELLLLWLTIRRQYRVRGGIAPMPDALVETYWNQKVHESRLLDLYYATHGANRAWSRRGSGSSRGSRRCAAGYPSPESVPRPELLRGVYLVPERIEMWRGSPDRLHDRRRFAREGAGWREETLVP